MLCGLAIVVSAGLFSADIAAADLYLPVNEHLVGRWNSTESSERGRLEASLKPVGEGEYEMWFKVTGSSVFNAEGKPYPDEGIYPLKLERTADDELSFTYRQPFPRIKPLFFVPRSLTYRVTLEGPVSKTGADRWTATVNDHNLSLSLWVRPGSIVGMYDYDGRWASAAGTFKLVIDRSNRPAPTSKPLSQGVTTAD